MQPDNTGSFGAAIGGGDAIKAAMARRGMGAGVTQQVSPAAPTFGPGVPPQVPGTQTAPVAPAGPQTPTPAGGAPGLPQGSFESQIIIKALSDRLKSNSKIEEAKAIPPAPTGGF